MIGNYLLRHYYLERRTLLRLRYATARNGAMANNRLEGRWLRTIATACFPRLTLGWALLRSSNQSAYYYISVACKLPRVHSYVKKVLLTKGKKFRCIPHCNYGVMLGPASGNLDSFHGETIPEVHDSRSSIVDTCGSFGDSNSVLAQTWGFWTVISFSGPRCRWCCSTLTEEDTIYQQGPSGFTWLRLDLLSGPGRHNNQCSEPQSNWPNKKKQFM